MSETLNRLNRATRQLVQDLGREPTPEELAQRMEISTEKVTQLLRASRLPISLETPIGDEGDARLSDLIDDEEAVDPHDVLAKSSLDEQTRKALATLTPREERVLRLRFGIGERSGRTLEEVGQMFELTRERIRQIEAQALRKLRHPSRAAGLRGQRT